MIHRPDRSRQGTSEHQVRFPYGTLAVWIILLLIGVMVVYRLSESAGSSYDAACRAAILVAAVAAAGGLIPVWKVWGRDLLWVVLGVFLSGIIRLLIGVLGVLAVILFSDLQRLRFVGFLALFYVAFMAIDIWLALWVLRNTKIEKDEDGESVIHGNVWDIVVRH